MTIILLFHFELLSDLIIAKKLRAWAHWLFPDFVNALDETLDKEPLRLFICDLPVHKLLYAFFLSSLQIRLASFLADLLLKIVTHFRHAHNCVQHFEVAQFVIIASHDSLVDLLLHFHFELERLDD